MLGVTHRALTTDYKDNIKQPSHHHTDIPQKIPHLVGCGIYGTLLMFFYYFVYNLVDVFSDCLIAFVDSVPIFDC